MKSKDNNLNSGWNWSPWSAWPLPYRKCQENNSQFRVYAIVCLYVCLFLVKFAYIKICYGTFLFVM